MNDTARRRVLLVLATSTGGVGRHVAGLLPRLPAAGWAPLLAAPRSTLEHLGLEGADAVGVVGISSAPHPLRDARAVRALRALLRAQRLRAPTDVVHAHGIRAGFVALLALRTLPARTRPALVVTLHNAVLAAGARGRLGRAVERVVVRGADVVLAVSGDLVARAREAGARQVDRALVPAPPAPGTRRSREQVRADLGVASAPLVLAVARLAPQKGLPLLLDAVALLPRRAAGDPPVVVVAGDGPLRGRLQERAAAEGLPVRWLGTRSDVADLLAAADVVVSTSEWEGQPLLLQEALRAGAALVATDVGGVREVTGDAAVLVPYGDAPALAEAVAALLEQPAARERLRSAALRRAGELPAEADAVDQLAATYAHVAGRGRCVG